MNFADVEDAAQGHLLAADKGKRRRALHPRRREPELARADRARRGGLRPPPPGARAPPETARVAQIREALKLPSALPAEGFGLMSKDWRFSSEKAKRELGYTTRPLDDTIRATVDWYLELIEGGAFLDEVRSEHVDDRGGARAGGRVRAAAPGAPRRPSRAGAWSWGSDGAAAARPRHDLPDHRRLLGDRRGDRARARRARARRDARRAPRGAAARARRRARARPTASRPRSSPATSPSRAAARRSSTRSSSAGSPSRCSSTTPASAAAGASRRSTPPRRPRWSRRTSRRSSG